MPTKACDPPSLAMEFTGKAIAHYGHILTLEQDLGSTIEIVSLIECVKEIAHRMFQYINHDTSNKSSLYLAQICQLFGQLAASLRLPMSCN